MAETSNNKKIAINTIYLYIRMFFTMGISLYSSRLILQILGIEDFGLYNLVGGIVALMSFLNTSMSGATSRFLTFDLGRNDFNHLKKTFNSAFQIHIIIALIVLILGECIGGWIVNFQLNIPETRLYAANIVFQASLFTSLISIIQVPFSATLIAHERMDLYALIEILNVSLKLGAIYITSVISYDQLIIYTICILSTAILVLLLYYICCKKRFKECTFTYKMHKEIIKPMISFSSWDLYGNGCVVARQQGTNIILNHFWGVSINAASGIATQVSAAVSLFISNITLSIKPQLIKEYAGNNIVTLQKLLSFALIICLILIECIIIPIYLNIETIMHLWLQKVPPYAIEFSKIMLISNTINVAISLFNTLTHATGKIKILSILEGTLFLLSLPISYCLFIYIPNPTITYFIWLIIICIALIVSILIAKENIKQLSIKRIFKDLKFVLAAVILTIYLTSKTSLLIHEGVIRIIFTTISNFIFLIIFLYTFWIIPVFKGSFKSIFKYFS